MALFIGEKCTGCTACARLCPVFSISGERGQRHVINPLRCVECGVCGRVCPAGAISAGGKDCVQVKRPQWPRPSIDAGICSACGICVHDCTPGALSISLPKERGDIRVHAELSAAAKCIGCGICEKHCPMRAITMALPQEAAAGTPVSPKELPQ